MAPWSPCMADMLALIQQPYFQYLHYIEGKQLYDAPQVIWIIDKFGITYLADRPVKWEVMWQMFRELSARVNYKQFSISLTFLEAFTM